jgi:hypothetical protein
MVSRRKILSRSRDDLNMERPAPAQEEEDIWYQKEKLFKVGTRNQQRVDEYIDLVWR